MLPKYEDILAAVGDKQPLWWDEYGVPRFAPFHPDLLGVYDNYAVLADVVCASCRKHMLVGIGRPRIAVMKDLVRWDLASVAYVAEAWGDPPRHDCPGAGETMACDDVTIVEAWAQDDRFDWVKRPVPAGTRPPDTTPIGPAPGARARSSPLLI